MPIVAYNEVAERAGRIRAEDWPTVTLIYGEELLCKNAYDLVMDKLVPPSDRATGVEVFDGGEDSMGSVLSSLNTYALLSSAKLVVLRDARLFYTANARTALREKMIQAGESGSVKKAARSFLNLMAIDGLDFEDLRTPTHRRKIVEDVDGGPPAWFDQLLDYCREKGLVVPEKRDGADLLQAAMEKGFPEGHRLLITADVIDRRKALFKAIEQDGLAVNCSVPKGETRTDRMAREAVMQAAVDEALAKVGKTMAADARRRLTDWTGFDLRTLAGNLEKLIGFVGDRKTIRDADVTSVLQRTRKDPIFAFTNAVADRDLPGALLLMQSLLDDGMHPLQLLSAVANQVRRLLLAKDFIVKDGHRRWSARMSFPQFKSGYFGDVQAADESFFALMENWDALADPDGKPAKRKKKPSSDLVLARNPKSPFPVFQTLKKADHFSLEELTAAVGSLSQTDLRMKSTGQEPRLLLEALLIGLCKRS
jgi:DNA polymerase III subunit delta